MCRGGAASPCRPSRTARGRRPGGSCSRTAVPTSLSTEPPLPITIPFCDSRSTRISQRMRGPLPLGDPGRDRVRQLVAGDGEQLLAHELGDPERLGHVGDHVVGVVAAGPRAGGRRGARRARRRRRRSCADTGKYSLSSSSRGLRSCVEHLVRLARCRPCSRRRPRRAARRAATNRSPRPSGSVASITRHTTSTSPSASVAVALSRVPSAVPGLWMPGVSTNTICASGRVSTPRTWVRVVCGLSETIVTFVPRMRLSSVDFPTLGRPTSVTNPERNVTSSSSSATGSQSGSAVTRTRADAAAVDLLDA